MEYGLAGHPDLNFGCFCLHLSMRTNHNNLNFLLISQFIGHNISDFKYYQNDGINN